MIAATAWSRMRMGIGGGGIGGAWRSAVWDSVSHFGRGKKNRSSSPAITIAKRSRARLGENEQGIWGWRREETVVVYFVCV
jgi:hypothetical protein